MIKYYTIGSYNQAVNGQIDAGEIVKVAGGFAFRSISDAHTTGSKLFSVHEVYELIGCTEEDLGLMVNKDGDQYTGITRNILMKNINNENV